MHQIAFGGRAPPGLAEGACPDPLAAIGRPTTKGGRGEGREGRKGRIVSPCPAPQFQNPKTATGPAIDLIVIYTRT